MATTDRTDAAAPAEAVAGRLREASFATVLARADGACLAAAGLLADACVATGTPYQVCLVRTREELRSRREAADETATVLTIGLGADASADDHSTDADRTDHPSVGAFEAARALGADPDPALALAGVVAGEGAPEDAAPSILERADIERRPGLATPTSDPADALAHTTLAHVGYSGDLEAAGEVVAEIPDDDGREAADRRLASLLAIDAVSADGATERAAHAVERAIHPHAGGPLGTVEGYADVVGSLAATAPGLGVTLALAGDDARQREGRAVDAALDAWREHAVAAHEAVNTAETSRHGGLLVARTDGPVEVVARLLRDFRSPEPAVLAVGGRDVEGGRRAEAALATVDAPAEPIEAAAEAADGSGLARGIHGYARLDGDRTDEFVDAVRGAI